MRWIFLTLVVANLAVLFFFWQQPQASNTQDSPESSVDDNRQGKRLRLVSEQSAVPERSRTPNISNRAPICYVAGPYDDELDAKHLLARAASLGFKGQLNTLKVPTDKVGEYWVHVPPRANRTRALRVLKELQQRQVDAYIITQGELADGISLGLFRKRESADALYKQVSEYGIDVAIKDVAQSKTEYWIELPNTKQLTPELRQRILANDTDIEWQQANCK